MDTKTADEAMRNKKPVMYDGRKYVIKEMVIWYDSYNSRKCSLVLTDDNKNIMRAKVKDCDVYEA